MDTLTETYNNLSNNELIHILSNQDKYRTEATEVAYKILSLRNISNEDIETLIAEAQAKAIEKAANEKPSFLQLKLNTLSDKVLEIANPVQSEKPTADKTINHISLAFTVIFILYLFKNIKSLWLYITDDYYTGFETFIYFIPVIYIPLSTYIFYKRKKIGWILISIYVTFILSACIISFYQDIMWTETYSYTEDEMGQLYNLNPQPNLLYGILAIILFSVLLYAICKNSVRSIFKITRETMLATIVTTSLFLIILLYKIV